MEEKFKRRYLSYKNSLHALSEARERDMTDSFVLSGTSAKFCITFDLAWKVMKDILTGYYAITDFVAGSPREVLKKAFQASLIHDNTWMEMLQMRNQLSHDYDGDIIKSCCKLITENYLNEFYEFQETVEALLKNESD
ncbi:MAG TPA: antitoxin [Lachnospiraceae bacterium]|nr:antitoxin [Lachnospiraceae bacterium]